MGVVDESKGSRMVIKGEQEDLIKDTIASFVKRAFPGRDVGLVEYVVSREPACDVAIYDVSAMFELGNGDVELSFRVTQPCLLVRGKEPEATVGPIRASWDMEGEDGEEHLMPWDDAAGSWGSPS
jgi:hypothetical protein